MPRLDTKARNALTSEEFALPSSRSYPINDASHAQNAIARAAQMLKAGHLSQDEHDEIVRKAHRRLDDWQDNEQDADD